LVFGLRAGSTGGLALDLALEIGTGSVGHAFGPPLPTWNFIFGFGYAFDPAQNRPIVRTVTVERVVEKPVAPPLGFVGGRVVNATTGEPIAGAIIDVPGRTRVRVATDSDGAFVSKGFAAGPVDLEISAPGYGAQAVRATVQVGATTPVEVSLLPMPPPDLTPAAPTPPATPAPPAPTSDAPLPPPSGAVSLQAGRLVLRNPIRFVGSPTTPTAELTADSRQILDEVAAFLRQQPAVDKIRIEAHWDSGIDRALALQITQDQANAVAQYLASRGFARDGIEAEGFGATRPRGPNLGPQSRARNRRIEISLPGLLARP
jgi:hypothetical protein